MSMKKKKEKREAVTGAGGEWLRARPVAEGGREEGRGASFLGRRNARCLLPLFFHDQE